MRWVSIQIQGIVILRDKNKPNEEKEGRKSEIVAGKDTYSCLYTTKERRRMNEMILLSEIKMPTSFVTLDNLARSEVHGSVSVCMLRMCELVVMANECAK